MFIDWKMLTLICTSFASAGLENTWYSVKRCYLGLNLICVINLSCIVLRKKKSHLNRQNWSIIISVVCLNLWKITCAMVIQQTVTDSDMVIKQVFADPRRKRGQTNLSTSPEIYWIYDLTTFYNRSLNSMHLINACTITGCTLLLTKFPNLVNIFCIMKSNKRSLKKKILHFNICGWTSR